MAKSWFLQQTYERRQKITSRWTIEEMVYGEVGSNGEGSNHAIHDHFKENAQWTKALPEAVNLIKQHWGNIVYPHPVDFEELYARVKKLIGSIKGIGFVSLYDISLHIGCNIYPKVLPEKKVYLNANEVRDAAKVLIPGLNLPTIVNAVDASLFDEIFPYWSPMEIENILCLYSDQIQKGVFSLKSLKKQP